MRVFGVIDLVGGQAVHGKGGCREHYRPVQSVGGAAIEAGNALAVARAYVQRLGITELYLADLDALSQRPIQAALIPAIAAIGAPLLVDAGVTSVVEARRVLALKAAGVVVALETLTSFEALRDVCANVGGGRVAFSLDLRRGQPIVRDGGALSADEPAHEIAARAHEAGAGSVIVIDLARVGLGEGLDIDLLARIRRAAPGATLLAGGGARDAGDLDRLADVGVDGVLLATSLHTGRIGADAIAAAGGQRSVSR